ncbi:MAG: hypothetical protein M0Z69_00945 [Actinomycetota bacterium]|nr:hypothetical protein [Actinomycetota bacterium]
MTAANASFWNNRQDIVPLPEALGRYEILPSSQDPREAEGSLVGDLAIHRDVAERAGADLCDGGDVLGRVLLAGGIAALFESALLTRGAPSGMN